MSNSPEAFRPGSGGQYRPAAGRMLGFTGGPTSAPAEPH